VRAFLGKAAAMVSAGLRPTGSLPFVGPMVIQLLIAIVLAAAALAGGVVLMRAIVRELRALRDDTGEELTSRSAEVDRRLLAIDEKLDRRLADLDTKVDRRMENASKQSVAIHEQLTKVGETTAQVLEQAKAFGRLEQALRPPKARGGFGELLLENLLRDRLPRDSYQLQYSFASGERVDAILRVDRLVPIDAKFPLDNFERLAAAETDEERLLFEKAFARDLKGHVDAISTKYIRPDEGTYDFALMYLPAESVYYELVCGKTGSLSAYAHGKRVIPVSPSTLHAYLLMVTQGLRALQIERHAEDVMAFCAQIGKDFERFRGDFEVVGKHIGNAQTKYVEADRRLERLGTSLERATEWEPEAVEAAEAQQELPRALDAA
jgi:DNA recombination protein RmuC